MTQRDRPREILMFGLVVLMGGASLGAVGVVVWIVAHFVEKFW